MKIRHFSELAQSFFDTIDYEEITITKTILDDIQRNGDTALIRFAREFDNLGNQPLQISKKEIDLAYQRVDDESLEMLKKAILNIKEFAQFQFSMFKDLEMETNYGKIGHKIVPINRVGCYVPGGRFPLPSTALMSVIPAKVAGVKEIIVCSPNIRAITIVAADLAGADKIYRIGGIQAIGAMAFGTKSIPKVDKIVGPGNKFVTAAKKQVFGGVGIDLLAGPSEVMIIADDLANAEFVAADLIAQAEHDLSSRPDLITTSREFADKVLIQLTAQLKNLATKKVAEKSIENGFIIIVDDMDDAVTIANRKAPEHLELQIEFPNSIKDRLTNYGSLFIGNASAEVFGDYCTGPNHTLPTNGAARYTGGLSVKDFIKILTYQELHQEKISEIAEISEKLAILEGLYGHAQAARMRMDRQQNA